MSEYNMTHTGKELDDAIAKVQSGYVFPDQAATVTKNGIYDKIGEIPVKLIDEIEVAVPVPDGYISLSDILTHTTQKDSGTFVGAGQTCEKISIGVDFRPKIILIAATSPITTSNTGSPYEICAVWRIYNNNFSVLRDNCVFAYKSGSYAKTGHTASNGLRGNADNTITGWGTSAKFSSGVTYSWYAWG